jgi:N6-L-threonylcarbamoyladenine synthase
MKILGIETSADETSAAVVEDGRRLLSNATESQIDIHQLYGGIVPEISARSHIEVILPVIQAALQQAKIDWDDIDAVAVTYAPGLVGSLLIGTLAARTLALVKHKPLYPVHHVKAHVYANFLLESPPKFPILALIVSGGHSQLVLFKSHQKYEILGRTQDDAVGEAFDKVAKILGLPYPGGPSIERAAQNGDPNAFALPKAKLAGAYDFSFSGLKTATLRAIQKEAGKDFRFPSHQLSPLLSQQQINDFAASFEKTAIETLIDKTLLAYKEYSPASVVIAGGVAASQALRRRLSERLPITITYPPLSLCTDNAAMVAALAYYQSQFESAVDPRVLEVVPSLSM